MSDLDISVDLGRAGFRFNLAGVEAQEFTSIPPGIYAAEIGALGPEAWGKTGEQAKNPGEPKLDVTFIIDGGDHDGRKVWRTYTFGEKARWRVKELLAASGRFSAEHLDGTEDLTPELLDERLPGARVLVKVIRKPSSRTRNADGHQNDVDAVYPIDDENALRRVQQTISNYDPRMP